MHRLRKRLGNDTGAELIEFAIVFPLLMVVVASIIDFGFLFQRYEVVTNAAREGARIGSLPGYSDADICQRVQNYLTASGLTTTVTCTDIVITHPTETLPSGMTVSLVKVVVPYPSSFSFMGSFIGMIRGGQPSDITLKASSTMRVETGGA
jgi:Flp pilus assembly protein TadG